MVISFIPKATFPDEVCPKAHDPGSEKSSLRITPPKSGRYSGVGVIGKVGITVAVAVAGNHSTVAVGMEVRVVVGVFSKIGNGLSDG
jgi:hypothetical protein